MRSQVRFFSLNRTQKSPKQEHSKHTFKWSAPPEPYGTPTEPMEPNPRPHKEIFERTDPPKKVWLNRTYGIPPPRKKLSAPSLWNLTKGKNWANRTYAPNQIERRCLGSEAARQKDDITYFAGLLRSRVFDRFRAPSQPSRICICVYIYIY